MKRRKHKNNKIIKISQNIQTQIRREQVFQSD